MPTAATENAVERPADFRIDARRTHADIEEIVDVAERIRGAGVDALEAVLIPAERARMAAEVGSVWRAGRRTGGQRSQTERFSGTSYHALAATDAGS
jgi:hypothetical protein